MNIPILKYIGILLIAFALVSCNDNTDESSNMKANAKPAIPTLPSMDLQTEDGQFINLSSLKGKKIFLNLWATWCPPCRAEMPSIQRLAAKVDSTKVAFVMLSLDEEFKFAIDYANQTKLNLPVYYPNSGLPPIFQTAGIPVTYIFNEKGELIFRHDSAENYDQAQYVNMLTK